MKIKILKYLDKKTTLNFYNFLILNSLIFFLEFLSLASIPLFISAMITPEFLIEKINYYEFLNFFEDFNNIELFKYASYIVLITFFLKNIFLIALTYFQGKYFRNLNKVITKKIFDFYVLGPFSIHLNSNPSQLARNVSYEINGTTSYLNQILMLTRDILTLIVVFFLLSSLNLFIALGTITVLMVILFIYLTKTKPAVRKLANFNQKIRKIINQTIFETFGAIKDIKVLNKERGVINFFNEKISNYEDNYFKFNLIEKLPKFLLELFAITLIVILGLILSSYFDNLDTLLPMLSVIAISLLRLIPAFNSLNANYNYLRLYNVSMNLILDELKKIDDYKPYKNTRDAEIKLSKKNFIELKDLTFKYNNAQNTFEKINFKVNDGEKVCIIGPTGSGKTTLFHLILGLIKPNDGVIAHKGESIFSSLENWYKKIGYISQNLYMLDSSIKDNITLNYNDDKIRDDLLQKSLSVSQLDTKINNSTFGLETKVGMDGIKLSGGEKQRIAIARAVYKDPEIFLMDEFTSAIDQATEEKIFDEFKKNFPNKTLIMIAHRKSVIDKCDTVWKVQNRKIIKIK